jgi:hypothetical protein
MKHALRITLAVLVGLLLGSLVNMGLLAFGGKLIPAPLGVDATSMAGLKATIHLFEPRHFLFPFLAHALGTVAGAAVAAWLAPVARSRAAYIVGGLFLVGGIVNCVILPAPLWFILADVILAYLPMAWLGRALAPNP